jgi:AcrR family transcriptional regulator
MPEADAKDRIIKAVRDMLEEGCPPEDITVRQIAKRAGVGIGTVSYHYHSKEKLVYEAVGSQMAGTAVVLKPGSGQGTPQERLRLFINQTAELALRYSAVFAIQLSYEMIHGDMSICYTITPLLKEIYGAEKTDLEVKLIALELISMLQAILLKLDAFQRYTGIDIRDAGQREEALDNILKNIIR